MNPETEHNREKIRITMDDLRDAAGTSHVTTGRTAPPARGGASSSTMAQPFPAASADSNILMEGWCHLGLAGLVGSLVAWAICEPSFSDSRQGTWANLVIFPLMLVLMCVGFGVAESAVERAPRKAAIRGLVALLTGLVFGFVFYFIANVIFNLGLAVLSSRGNISSHDPGLWIIRAIAWAGFGVAGGIVYGIAGQSGKKCLYGVAGGAIGAGLGGFLFDPIVLATGGAAMSRAVGMALCGAATGVAMGLVEGALKDRWLYVSVGPLAGKQFILYKNVTTIGSDQQSDIYLFKDPGVQPRHATFELRGSRVFLRASGPVSIQGRQVREAVLASGDSIEIGRYAFLYRDRQRLAK